MTEDDIRQRIAKIVSNYTVPGPAANLVNELVGVAKQCVADEQERCMEWLRASVPEPTPVPVADLIEVIRSGACAFPKETVASVPQHRLDCQYRECPGCT